MYGCVRVNMFSSLVHGFPGSGSGFFVKLISGNYRRGTNDTGLCGCVVWFLSPYTQGRCWCWYIQTFWGVVVANVSHRVPDNLLVVHGGTGRHFSCQQDHSSLGYRFWKRINWFIFFFKGTTRRLGDATQSETHRTQTMGFSTQNHLFTTSNFGIWVLLKMGIKNSVTDLVTDLICSTESKNTHKLHMRENMCMGQGLKVNSQLLRVKLEVFSGQWSSGANKSIN